MWWCCKASAKWPRTTARWVVSVSKAFGKRLAAQRDLGFIGPGLGKPLLEVRVDLRGESRQCLGLLNLLERRDEFEEMDARFVPARERDREGFIHQPQPQVIEVLRGGLGVTHEQLGLDVPAFVIHLRAQVTREGIGS